MQILTELHISVLVTLRDASSSSLVSSFSSSIKNKTQALYILHLQAEDFMLVSSLLPATEHCFYFKGGQNYMHIALSLSTLLGSSSLICGRVY